jgi:hypothetical protein
MQKFIYMRLKRDIFRLTGSCICDLKNGKDIMMLAEIKSCGKNQLRHPLI